MSWFVACLRLAQDTCFKHALRVSVSVPVISGKVKYVERLIALELSFQSLEFRIDLGFQGINQLLVTLNHVLVRFRLCEAIALIGKRTRRTQNCREKENNMGRYPMTHEYAPSVMPKYEEQSTETREVYRKYRHMRLEGSFR
jgi:hypothetical protein